MKEEGTYTATVTPKKAGGNFDGKTTALIKVAAKDKLLSNAKVTFDQRSYAYTGKEIVPKYTLKIGETKLTEGRDYRMAGIAGNTEPGTATMILEALSGNSAGYAGSKTAAFKISGKVELKDAAPFDYSYASEVPYVKGGAKPVVTVKHDGVTLKEGTDYTVSYEKNRAVTDGAKAVIRIKGKGNYKGDITKTFAVTKQSLSVLSGNIAAADRFEAKDKVKAPLVTIKDTNGKKLKAGTDYTVGKPDLSDPQNTGESGIASVMVTGKGNYRDDVSVKVFFRYMSAASGNIANAKKMKDIEGRYYTGYSVRLDDKDLTQILYTGKKDSPGYLVPGKDFRVEAYADNVKKGTAKVTLTGLGSFAGTKTLTFKIKEKSVDWKGALVGGKWH